MLFTLIDTESPAGLAATINGIECKQAQPPHHNKVLWKPVNDWIKSDYTVGDLLAEIRRKGKEAKRKQELEEAGAAAKEDKKNNPIARKGDLADRIIDHIGRRGEAKSSRELSEELAEKRPSVYAAIKRLQKRKLIIRGKDKYFGASVQPTQAFKLSKSGVKAWMEMLAEAA